MAHPIREYKESGIQWLGLIPDNWDVAKFKYLARIKNGKDQKKVLSENGIYPILGTGGVFGLANEYLYDKPSVLLGRKGTIDKPQFIEEPFWTVDTLFYTEVKQDVEPKFLFYLSSIIPFLFLQESSAVPSMTQDKLSNVFLVKPNKSEQSQIAAYLDYHTGLIDELIAKKEQLIKKLEEQRQAVINEAVTKGIDKNCQLKKSEDDWLNKEPNHWTLSKMRYVADIKGRIGFKGYTKNDLVSEGEGALTLGAKHIDKENNLNLADPEFISWEKYYESPEIMIKSDDLIFTQRGSLGKVCHIVNLKNPATINPSMVILRTNHKVSPRFLYYWLVSSRIKSEVELLQANTAVPMISQFQLSNFPILLPPINEQIDIINHLDKSLSQQKQIINNVYKSVKNLKDYRQSLISEAVTGKIDVRDWKHPEK